MALYMVFIEDAEDRNGERCIMPTSEHLEDMVVLVADRGVCFLFCRRPASGDDEIHRGMTRFPENMVVLALVAAGSCSSLRDV